jgi:hypothetical protein
MMLGDRKKSRVSNEVYLKILLQQSSEERLTADHRPIMLLQGLKFPHRLDTETRTSTNMLQMRFEVLMAASMKMAVFWIVATCSQVKVY